MKIFANKQMDNGNSWTLIKINSLLECSELRANSHFLTVPPESAAAMKKNPVN